MMASDPLQILNLSPIPELSEMELSTVLEQLSGLTDLNGEVTDRNVEEILREAEELMDASASIKADSFDSKSSMKCDENSYQKSKSSNPINDDDSNTANEILNLSILSEEDSIKVTKSESVKSGKNEMDSSHTELSSTRTPRSLTNHIQSTLDSLRECSKKLEDQTKNSPHKTAEVPAKKNSRKTASSLERTIKKSIPSKSRVCFGEESDKIESENSVSDHNIEQMQKTPSVVKRLNFDESIKTLDCFERLYRGKPARTHLDKKKFKSLEMMRNQKKLDLLRGSKSVTTCKSDKLCRERKLRQSYLQSMKKKVYTPSCFDGRLGNQGKSFTDDDISFEKCLELLNEESGSQSNQSDGTNFNCSGFAEQLMKQYKSSVTMLQKEIEELRLHLKKSRTGDSLPNWDSSMTRKFWSQENLIQTLRDENSKLFKEIEAIKGRLKLNGGEDAGSRDKKEEALEDLKAEVDNLRRCLTAATVKNNGLQRLEEQFVVLKAKYDEQVEKLEVENRKLKITVGDRIQAVDVGVQTEVAEKTIQVPQNTPRRELIRSMSLENCSVSRGSSQVLSQSCENVVESRLQSAFAQTERESCSVSVQCRSEIDLPRQDLLREIQKSDNKENSVQRRAMKNRLIQPTQNALRQRKISEHENELMVTLRALHSEVTVKDRENKKMKNELELLRNQVKKLSWGVVKQTAGRKFSNAGTQTIGLGNHEPYDPAMFQVSKELENENEDLKLKLSSLEKMVEQLKEKRIHDLQILQKLHEEEIDKLASRLNTQTALTNHLHSLLLSR